ncbi:GNAT family N-acetyltransferase [Micromonospora aurantiaca (nom. illeg.)]|uniref:GNAT family N-acetyltransferase n=1 Tax=Micromonospora aurantiaca (nom. illeg.) TaxID=47850 RepID=UPI003404F5A8
MNRDGGRWDQSVVLPNRGIRRATRNELRAVAELLAQAFLYGPVADWLVPGNPQARLTIYRNYFTMWIGDALRRGTVEVNEDLTCAAVWYPPEADGGHPADYDSWLALVAGPHLERFAQLDRAMAAAHPRQEHEYLAFLAVHPNRQRLGQGTRMLAHRHAGLDQIQRGAYLEASNERNRDLYLRHGYEVTGEIRLPGGPSLWPMWRRPAPRKQHQRR